MDDLERKIELLRKSLAAAWTGLAKPCNSTIDKCERRAQAKRCSEELRRCLLIAEAKRTHEHAKALSDQDGRALPKPNFRFLLVEAATEAGGRDKQPLSPSGRLRHLGALKWQDH